MLFGENSRLTTEQRNKVNSILNSVGKNADAMLLDVSALEKYPENSICLSVLAHVNKRGEMMGAQACFIEPNGRHHWAS